MTIKSKIYKNYSRNGNLESKSDSCNSRLLPTGIYTKYDTITKKIIAKGKIQQCSFNSFTSCEDGWWNFYSEDKLTSQKLYKGGRVIEEKNFR